MCGQEFPRDVRPLRPTLGVQDDTKGTNRMAYNAIDTLQITFIGEGESPTLKVHESRPDGTPYCGVRAEPADGKPATYTRQGPGTVTCGSCARTLAGPQRR
jgi:hypothetical protein